MTGLHIADAVGLETATFAESEAGRRRFSAEELQTLCALLKITPTEVYEERGGS